MDEFPGLSHSTEISAQLSLAPCIWQDVSRSLKKILLLPDLFLHQALAARNISTYNEHSD